MPASAISGPQLHTAWLETSAPTCGPKFPVQYVPVQVGDGQTLPPRLEEEVHAVHSAHGGSLTGGQLPTLKELEGQPEPAFTLQGLSGGPALKQQSFRDLNCQGVHASYSSPFSSSGNRSSNHIATNGAEGSR